MKKVFFSLVMIAGMFIAGNVNAQTTPIKIGYFDIDQMVSAMPGYRSVDSLLQIYQTDSLGTQYDFYMSEYHRLDSTYKADSAAGKAKAVLDLQAKQRQQVGLNLVYWQQISQNMLENKRAQLAQPLYEKVFNAYKKVLVAKKYNIILKPEALEQGTTAADNLFVLVAKELNITLPGAEQEQQQQQAPATQQQPAKPSGGATKPKQ